MKKQNKGYVSEDVIVGNQIDVDFEGFGRTVYFVVPKGWKFKAVKGEETDTVVFSQGKNEIAVEYWSGTGKKKWPDPSKSKYWYSFIFNTFYPDKINLEAISMSSYTLPMLENNYCYEICFSDWVDKYYYRHNLMLFDKGNKIIKIDASGPDKQDFVGLVEKFVLSVSFLNADNTDLVC